MASSQLFQEVLSNHQLLKKEWSKDRPDLKKCGELLSKLKVSLTEFSFLPTGTGTSKQELIVARDILEIGAQWSVAIKDIPSFERYIAQLKCYYFDFQYDHLLY